MVLAVPLFRLKCGANSYSWGKVGNQSAAARFAAASNPDFKLEEDKPYAEIWMGTHPNNPSYDKGTGRSLQELVEENEALLSPELVKKFGKQLPFLFKVLSIEKVLSIQAHPDKKLAERLHKEDPENYPDDNHKPEAALALTAFEGFVGFRPLEEINHFLDTVPPFADLVGDQVIKEFRSKMNSDPKAALKVLYGTVVQKPEKEIENAVQGCLKLCADRGTFAGGGHDALANLLTRLEAQYPNDMGTISALFLNYVTLQPGEAVYLKANDPHAYISGDIIECMANSDNVVRAGYTPKFKDVKNLTEMLTYEVTPIKNQKLLPTPYDRSEGDGECLLYDPPIEEFSLLRITMPENSSRSVGPINGPSIAIVTSGKGSFSVGPKTEDVSTGDILFIGATAKTQLKASEGFEIAWAFCELK